MCVCKDNWIKVDENKEDKRIKERYEEKKGGRRIRG